MLAPSITRKRAAIEAAIAAAIATASRSIVFGPVLKWMATGWAGGDMLVHLRERRGLAGLSLPGDRPVRLPAGHEPELLPRHRHHREHLRPDHHACSPDSHSSASTSW